MDYMAQSEEFEPNLIFEWEDGAPKPRGSKSMKKEQLQDLYHASLGIMYQGDWDPMTQTYVIDPLYAGMTYGQMMVFKQVRKAAESGEANLIEKVMDRVLGKPKQAMETVTMSLSYEEFMLRSAQEEQQRQQVIDITPESMEYYENSITEEDDLYGV